ncbi:DUF1835 domain-containing protein [Burkholderia pseudomallei]|uniref:DUF1835 domain-containing protein n=1 Tax=Burkholderia pseudomallei TaxID=28450 RepID=UPI000F0907BD|nr:DUF1835 domain-containing protein [Burkholderia pseudomallei]VBD52252.1 Domain of uncharacterised function (DUF1835) [Burkholderia pseudomallei]VBE82929.1 Domain of uncharacterised function (DUF1835) [Burkholderia pseudomallei]
MKTIHITPNNSAAGSLLQAVGKPRRESLVFALWDDLTVGPLRDIDDTLGPRSEATSDSECLRHVYSSARWDFDLIQCITLTDVPIVIWHGPCADDQLKLRRLSYRLRDTPQRLFEVSLSSDDISPLDRHHMGAGHPNLTRDALSVAYFTPETLRTKLASATPISAPRIEQLALEWQKIKEADAPWRRWRSNALENTDFEEPDARIVELATAEWQLARFVVGELMGTFLVSDAIALWRVSEAGAAGRIELRGNMYDLGSLKLRAVRAPSSCQ